MYRRENGLFSTIRQSNRQPTEDKYKKTIPVNWSIFMGSRILNFFANKWSSPNKKDSIDTAMSDVTTPTTLPDSLESAATPARQESSPPTSPATGSGSGSSLKQDAKSGADEVEKNNAVSPEVPDGDVEEDEDTEGMDMKARALTKLLQTSSVSYGIDIA